MATGVRRERTKHDLRCFCSRHPLLAVYGIDEKGRLYVHQRVYKGPRVFGESFFYGGTIKLLCRECFRWNEVVIRNRNTVILHEVDPPEVLTSKVGPRDSLQHPSASS